MSSYFIPSILAALTGWAAAATISGEPKLWHKMTLDFSGPDSGEAASPNPFTDYRLDVTFTHAGTGTSYRVPGYFAADGNAAESSATSGNVWRVHFAPDETGPWAYSASFRSGTDVAIDSNPAGGIGAGFFDGETGSFEIGPTDKSGRDFRGKGRLQYVGKHHLRFAGTGEYFMKAGADSPENLLAYTDFDGDFKTDLQKDALMKSWAPHVADWQQGDPVWQGGKGKGIIGAINYLAAEGLNSFSFLSMNINGDDRNVFPYTTYAERLRLDVSKLAQWEIVFEHGTRKGMYLHFKTQETENELLLDGGNLGPQRRLYYRELIARFGHHLALNWNLGEEINDATTAQKVAWSQFFYDNDPHRHHQVIHNGARHYEMMGSASHLTGFSRQMNAADFTDTFVDIKNYIDRSVTAGKPWVVAADEPGDAVYSVRPDYDPGDSHTNARKHALWAAIMAGGAGCEFYFGSAYPNSDLTCNDFRSRDAFWDCCRHALQFLKDAAVPFERMKNQNLLVSGNGPNANRCLAETGKAYLVHLPAGGTADLNLSGAPGSFAVTWFNPRDGETTNRPNLEGGATLNLGSPPDNPTLDWVVFVRLPSSGGETNGAPTVDAGGDRTVLATAAGVSLALGGAATDDGLPAASVLTRTWSQVSGPAGVSFSHAGDAAATATFTAAGSYVLRLTATDGELASSDELTVAVIPKVEATFLPAHDAYTSNGKNYNTTGLRVENGNYARIAYLQFDLGTIGPEPFSASLRLTEDNDISAGVMTLRVHAAASNGWTESGINGTNAPAKGAELASFTGSIADGVAVDFDLTGHVTGPGVYSFIVSADPSTLNTTFCSSEHASTALRPRLTVTTVEGTFNHAPVVGAGPNGAVILSGESVDLLLAGSAGDDGLPEGSNLAVGWSLSAGPAPVVFADAASAATTATFTATGSYVLRLTASDGEKTTYDEIVVTVSPPPTNQAPVVNAGADRSAAFAGVPVAVSLAGSATDDGLPAGGSLAYDWTQVSGPVPAAYSNSDSAATVATFDTVGTYLLRLTVSDGELAASDDMIVTVSPPAADPLSFEATHDTYLQNGTNYHNNDLRLETTSRIRRSYLQFDLSTLVSPPVGTRLLLTESSDTSGGVMTVRLFAALSNNWTETGLNAGNAPAKGPEIAAFTGDITEGRTVEFEVGALVTGPGIYSFILEAGASYRDVAFASAENPAVAARPVLVVTFPQALPFAQSLSAPAAPAGGSVSLRFSPEGTQVRLGFEGAPDTRYVIERSADLIHWEAVHRMTAPPSGVIDWVDPGPPEGRGFYRISSK